MLDELLGNNEEYASRGLRELPKLPRRNLVVLTCMDHRIDPAAALGLELGDAMVLRSAGGRVTDSLIGDLEILERVAAKRGAALSQLELVLMQHTECGAAEVESNAPDDPADRVHVDLDALAADPRVPASLSVTGLVYNTASGRIELVERRSPLRGSD
jgi:carbonic anhydrase